MSLTKNVGVKNDAITFRKPSVKSLQDKKWFVLYTAPRAEKIAKRELEFKNYEVFLPVTKTLRVWKNRQKKMIDSVVFPSYIFIHTNEKYLAEACRVNKISTYLHCGGKPSKIEPRCIEGIKRMLELNQEISVSENFHEGELVSITQGPLAGYEGVLVHQKTKTKFGIHLKEINQTILVEICTSVLEKRIA
jgi:transcription antitermination factor NusG